MTNNYKTIPGPHDVLLGRGGPVNSHAGNVCFRQWASERKAAYHLAEHHAQKVQLAQEIIHLVQQSGGRFLQRNKEETWKTATQARVLTKTCQALREGGPQIKALLQKKQQNWNNRNETKEPVETTKASSEPSETLATTTITTTTHIATHDDDAYNNLVTEDERSHTTDDTISYMTDHMWKMDDMTRLDQDWVDEDDWVVDDKNDNNSLEWMEHNDLLLLSNPVPVVLQTEFPDLDSSSSSSSEYLFPPTRIPSPIAIADFLRPGDLVAE